jgi:NTE family protein
VLTVNVAEKPWGPDYVRFGLSLSNDFGGNAYFQALGTYRRP